MKSIGQFLKEARQNKGYTLEKVAQELKVRQQFLKYLEEDRYQSLPPEVYLKGFIKKYSAYLKINTNHALAMFRRSYTHQSDNRSAPPQPLRRPSLSITPNFIIGSIITLLIVIFLSFLYWQYRDYTGKPVLVIQSPQDNAILYQDYVEVIGQTDPGVSITINGQEAEVSADGSFAVAIGLEVGINEFTIMAQSQAGKETVVTRQVEVISSNP